MRRILMHVGPSVGNYEVLLRMVRDNVGFNSPEFLESMQNSLDGVSLLFGADKSYTPFIIPGGGTSVMEAAATFLQENDRILVASNGVFGDRWREIFRRYRVTVDYVNVAAGESVTGNMISERFGDRRYRMGFFTHVETSTGVRSQVPEIARELRKVSDFVVLDGVASIGGEEAEAAKWGIDYFVTASQKAIGAPPGAGIAVASGKLMESIPDKSLAGYSLNLANWMDPMESYLAGKGKYFATLPVHTILGLSYAIDLIREETMKRRVERHSNVRALLADGINDLGLGILAKDGFRSNTVTGVLTGDLDARGLISECFTHGVEFASGVHPSLAGKYLRIGHMGWVTENDAATAISVLRNAIRSISRR